jgi:pilus assembly protein CpaB
VERSKKIAAIALAFGCLAAILTYRWAGGNDEETVQAVVPQTVKVVVAKDELPSGTLITPELVETKTISKDASQDGAFTSIDKIVNRYTRDRILKGEQIVRGRILKKDQLYSLPVTIPPGMRAVTIGCNEVIGVGGFIKPGDYVDVLGTFDEDTLGKTATVPVLQSVQVLAISQEMKKEEDKPAKLSTSATLSVTLEQAQKVTLAEEKGRLRLALLPPGSKDKPGEEVVTPEELMPEGRSTSAIKKPTSITIKAEKQPLPKRLISADVRKPINKTSTVEVIRGVSHEVLEVDRD